MQRTDLQMDDAQARQVLARMDAAARDMSVPMRQIAERMERRVRNTFANETDPWGEPWAPWANPPAIIASRNRRNVAGVGKLLDEGHLFSSIRREHDETSMTLTIGEDLPYGSIHQWGGEAGNGAEIPARAHFPLRTPNDTELPAEWYDDAALPLYAHILEAAGEAAQ